MNRYFKALILTLIIFTITISIFIRFINSSKINKKSRRVVNIRSIKEYKKSEKEINKNILKSTMADKEIVKYQNKEIMKKVVAKRAKFKRVIAKKRIIKKKILKKRDKKKSRVKKVILKQDRRYKISTKHKRVSKKIVNRGSKRVLLKKSNRVVKRGSKKKVSYGRVSKINFLETIRSKIRSNIVYPVSARAKHIEGVVVVNFDIGKFGELKNFKFIRAKRVFRKSVKSAFRAVFPIKVPDSLKRVRLYRGISFPINFRID